MGGYRSRRTVCATERRPLPAGRAEHAPPSSGAPLASRTLRSVVAVPRAPAGMTSLTPSGPVTSPPAASIVAAPSLGWRGGGASLPPQAARTHTSGSPRFQGRFTLSGADQDRADCAGSTQRRCPASTLVLCTVNRVICIEAFWHLGRSFVGRFLTIALMGCGLASCVVLLPSLPYRDEAPALDVPDDPVAEFPAGKTTRADVVRALGPPSAAATDGNWIAYSHRLNYGAWHLYYVPGGEEFLPPQAACETIRYRNLIFSFDAYGRVFEVVTESDECRQTRRESICFDTKDLAID